LRLFYRFVLAFLMLAALSTGGLGWYVRQNRRDAETRRYYDEVQKACTNVRLELERQGDSDRRLVNGGCQVEELADRVAVRLERGDALEDMILGYHDSVPHQRVAYGLDELMLGTSAGDVIGADPPTFFAIPRQEVDRLLEGDPTRYALRLEPRPAIVARCTRSYRGGRVGYVGVHYVGPLLERIGKVLDVKVAMGTGPPAQEHTAQANCNFVDGFGARLPLVVAKPKTELYENLRQIDQAVFTAVLGSAGVALVLAIILARRTGGPVTELANLASKVATEQARPIRVRGSGEIADLSRAFNTMLEDLAATRRRLAATSRVAAWREVARRVAHEVKNPLAPIRAAVETLRRLRARDDPAFDEYFDEATRTVLDEVHRISNIVTEFTRFARLPPPRPTDLDVEDVVRQVVGLHKTSTGRVAYRIARKPPVVRADRDQIVQVLTNLVQNGLDAVHDRPDGAVTVTVDYDNAAHVAITVEDNGPGIAPEMQPRLFEPYATTKSTGTGLGLAIAQRIAIEHNGELSQLKGQKGAAFRLVLPLEGPPPMSETPSSGEVS
jgi:signal transduction histidine kinase